MPAATEILFAPSPERVVTSNPWAFLHWLRTVHAVDLPDWPALQRFSIEQSTAFLTWFGEFARLGPPEAPARRQVDLAAWAEILLHADLRPDDHVVLAGNPSWPWRAAEQACAMLTKSDATAASLLARAASASILVAPAQLLAEAAFPRRRERPDLTRLRSIIATGGPLSPEGRRRIYTWIKSDILLLARTSDTLWGNPLEPVYAEPAPTPTFFKRPPSALRPP